MMITLISDRSYSYERGRVFSCALVGLMWDCDRWASPGTFAEQLGYRGIFALSTV
jgi:hypothetical protein